MSLWKWMRRPRLLHAVGAMQRVCHLVVSIKTYLEDPSCVLDEETRQCPICSSPHRLRRHGSYRRYVFLPGESEAILIVVLRLLCAARGETVSLLPDFCLPKRQHGPGVLGRFLHAFAVEGRGLVAALRKARPAEVGHSMAQALLSGFERRCDRLRAYLAQCRSRLETIPDSILPDRRELARLVLGLVDPRGEVESSFVFHGQRFHAQFGSGLA